MHGLPLNGDLKSRRCPNLLFLVLLAVGLLLLTRAILHPSPFQNHSVLVQRLRITFPTQYLPLVPALKFDQHGKEVTYVKRLQGAVQVQTETFADAAKDGSDPWYDKFYAFEDYLKEMFPDVFEALHLEHFATHSLLLTWPGSDASLAPVVLMAHQDSVPVPLETVGRWTHPLLDGHVNEQGWMWGRGAADCKNLLIAELSAVSELVAAGFTPSRTVLLAFGFYEEGGAVHSARAIASHLEDVYGRDSMFMIVDEGGGVIEDYFGRTWVAPAMAEKGIVNIELSRPRRALERSPLLSVSVSINRCRPAHTAIGILSSLITTVEAHRSPVTLSVANPFAAFAQCLAQYGTIDEALRRALADEQTWPHAAVLMAQRDAGDAARLSTTQAVDVISGGLKSNALPEQARVLVNHRVSVDDSIREIQERYLALLAPDAKKYNLSVVGFGVDPPASATRYLRLFNKAGDEPSPVTPAEGSAWEHLWPGAIVAPYLSTGGTDTRAYVNLASAIFRLRAIRDADRAHTHTVDERVHVNGHMDAISWIHALIQNADAFRE